MRKISAVLSFFLLSVGAWGQGSVVFNNRVPGAVDARVVLPDGTGAGAGWTAQLFLKGSSGQLTALLPTTSFRTSTQAAMGYVEPITVDVPGFPGGSTVTLVMRAYNGNTVERSTLVYQSNPFTITVGGGLLPPANLEGLASFSLLTTGGVPTISVQPSSQPLVLGKSVSFQVEVSGTGPFTFQWLKDGVTINGANSSTFTLSNLTAADAGAYTVRVSNATGSVLSEAAQLSLPFDENSGAVTFNNRVGTIVDARVILPDGTPAGAGWTAQLYGAAVGETLRPLFPTTVFRTSPAGALGYVVPVDIMVSGVKPGAQANFIMRVYNGATFETSSVRLESNPITISVGGGLLPPANLVGLKTFKSALQVQAFVERLLPAGYAPGSRVAVMLRAAPPVGASVYAIEERPPLNWIVTAVSHNGSFDAATGKVKFGPFFDNTARVLSYEVEPPAGDRGVKEFGGVASLDGQNTLIMGATTIESLLLHPADVSPGDARVSISEMTAYGAAWRKGQSWPVAPSPIPIEFVTRAGTLWKNGEEYILDPNVSKPPLWWVAKASRRESDDGPRRGATEDGRAIGFVHPLFVPGEAVTVRVEVRPDANVSAYAAQDQVPAGWLVKVISDGGEFDAGQGLVKWGPFFDNAPRVLSYEILAPNEGPLNVAFSGMVSFDGNNAVVRGQRQARASSRLKNLTRRSDGKFELDLSGHVGAKLVVEGSSDLVQWVPVGLVNKPGGKVQFDDAAAGAQEFRFYRVLSE